MIDPWLLPGPRALTLGIAEDLVEGRQLVLDAGGGAEPADLRVALASMLAFSQVSLYTIYDVPTVEPARLLAQATSDRVADNGQVLPGVYWIEGIAAQRCPAWFKMLTHLAEVERNAPPLLRRRLVLPVHDVAETPCGLGIKRWSLDTLCLADLEVAARYHGTVAAAPTGPLPCLRSALAVQLARRDLPRFGALRALYDWLGVRDAALGDADVLNAEARRLGYREIGRGDLWLALWRAQVSVLLHELDLCRMMCIEENTNIWSVPYVPERREDRPPKTVTMVSELELTHLCEQLENKKVARTAPIWERIIELRRARNRLSHMEILSVREIGRLFGAVAPAWR